MYKWVIVGTAFVVLGMSWGIPGGAYGAFVNPMTDDAGWSRTAVSAAASISILIAFLVGVFWGWLSDRWNVRGVVAVTGLLMGGGLFLSGISNSIWHLYIFYGFMVGSGLGGAAGPLTAICARWFPEKPGLAIGIIYAGFGAGSALLPLLAERLISYGGWRFGFHSLSFFVWGAFVIGVLLLKEKRQPFRSSLATSKITGFEDSPDGSERPVEHSKDLPETSVDKNPLAVNLRSALNTREIWILLLMIMAADTILYMIMVHLVPRAVDSGLSSATAVTVLTVTGLSNMVCSIIGGAAGDRFGARRTYIGSMALLAFSMIWLIGSNSLWMFYVFAVAFGVGNGGWFPQVPVLAAKIFGTRYLGSIYAAILVGAGIGGMVGPILAGYIFDTTGSYKIAFAIAAAVAIAAVLFGVALSDRSRTCSEGNT